jgi:N-acetylmuramoyl-L-alanine amidase
VSPNGAFVQVVSLNKGINNINIKSKTGHAEKEIKYIINVPESENTAPSVIQPKSLSAVAKIIKNYAIIRTYPGQSRITPLLSGTVLNITGKIGNNYRFKYSDYMDGWISENDVQIVPSENFTSQTVATHLNIDSDENNVYLKVPLVQKLPFLIEQCSENQMNLKIFNAVSGIDLFSYDKAVDFIKELKWTQESKDCLKLSIEVNSKQFWGYNYYYEGDTLVLKLRKPPQTDANCPLKRKIICIDAGHGGSELGSVGPTGIPEKSINLTIAKKLRKILEKKGAKVIMTRDSDKDVGLDERVDKANSENVQVIVSIHNNALPDGKNPYEEHGTSTYYYHSQSLPLAKSIQQSLVKTGGLNDLGVFYSSFVLTRPTEAPSVLVEVGFMINPDEYSLLITPEFQEKAAEGISQGLENFFLSQI